MNSYTRQHMVTELKKLGYSEIKVKGGKASVETCPDGNLYYAYLRITGNVERRKKYNQVKPV